MRKLLSAIAAIALVGWASVAAAPATRADDPSPAITAPDRVYDNLDLPGDLAFTGTDLFTGSSRVISVTAQEDNCDPSNSADPETNPNLGGCTAFKLSLNANGSLTIPMASTAPSGSTYDGKTASGAYIVQSQHGDGTGLLIQIDGTADQINQSLALLTYTPDSGYSNDVSNPSDLTLSLTDGQSPVTVTQDVYIRVDHLNKPPDVTSPPDQDVAAGSTTELPSSGSPVFSVTDPDAHTDDLLMMVVWTTCGTFSLTGATPNGESSIQGLLQEPALNLPADVIDAITTALPSGLPASGFDTGQPDGTHTAFAALADLSDLNYLLSKVTYNAPMTSGSCSLVLQSHLWLVSVRVVVALLCAVLVSSPPGGAVQGVIRVRWDGPEESDEESSDLGDGQGDQPAVGVPFFDRVTVRKAWANIDRVMCRYQPVYWRTW